MTKERFQRLQALYGSLQGILDEERTAYDNLPAPIRENSERGVVMCNGIEAMEGALDALSPLFD